MIKLPKIICFPVTKWHLYGMLAYLLEIYDEEKFQNLKIEVYAVRPVSYTHLCRPDFGIAVRIIRQDGSDRCTGRISDQWRNPGRKRKSYFDL